jgi:hypothetical protein
MSDERLQNLSVRVLLFRFRVDGELPESALRTTSAKNARDICLDDNSLIERVPVAYAGSAPETRYRLTRKGKRVLAELIEQRKEGTAADSPTVETTAEKPAKGKPGRKSNAARDAEIAKEYLDGLDNRLWEGQANYLRQKHPDRVRKGIGSAKAWLSTLLRRVQERKKR